VPKSAALSSATEPFDVLTVEEVAALLRVTTNWVHEKCRTRARDPLPHRNVGRYLRFRRSEIIAWFNRAATPPEKTDMKSLTPTFAETRFSKANKQFR
jgi:predicted DNA-binding transcriptional regulator AlpA